MTAKTNPVNFEQFCDEPSESDLKKLTELANLLDQRNQLIESAEEQLKEMKKARNVLAQETIPSLLDELGISEIRLSDGRRVQVEDKMSCSTAGKWREVINEWLTQTGHDDIIKNEVVFKFPGDAHDQARDFIDEHADRDSDQVVVEHKRMVNAQTFGALVRELMRNGEDVPIDKLGIFIYKSTKIT